MVPLVGFGVLLGSVLLFKSRLTLRAIAEQERALVRAKPELFIASLPAPETSVARDL